MYTTVPDLIWYSWFHHMSINCLSLICLLCVTYAWHSLSPLVFSIYICHVCFSEKSHSVFYYSQSSIFPLFMGLLLVHKYWYSLLALLPLYMCVHICVNILINTNWCTVAFEKWGRGRNLRNWGEGRSLADVKSFLPWVTDILYKRSFWGVSWGGKSD